MITLVNSSWLRTSGYVLAATTAFIAARREVRRCNNDAGAWPRFWILAGGILLAMAMTRATDIGQRITGLGRQRARSGGWYGQRRELQAVVIVILGAAFVGAVGVALRRVPANRRHYLPEAVVVFALAAFAGVRLVSLHQVDAVLYRRRIHGVKIDAVVELAMLAAAVVIPFRHLQPSARLDE